MSIREARRRIKEAKETNAHSLDLTRVLKKCFNPSGELEKLLPEIKEIKKLINLDLSDNQITDISFFKDLSKLQAIDLGDNKITDITPLCNLTELYILGLSSNQINDISSLEKLTKLNSLYLSRNPITDFSILKKFIQLKSLGLFQIQSSDFDFLKNLTQLDALFLSYNQISNISFLKGITQLTRLHLSNNQIDDINVLSNLTWLKILDLHNNQITDLSALKNLKELTELSLHHNKITDISVLQHLRKLHNKAIEWLLPNPVENPPKEIVEQGLEAVWKYFDEQEKQDWDYVYETKVLIVGETETGKTTLFKKLLKHDYLPQKGTQKDKKSTVGINIQSWKFPYTINPKKEITAHLWDFGGQEIQYTLHQYFLTKSSFYIFLISNRVGDNEKIHKADYWFKVISAFGQDCPVLVVMNERNDRSANSFEIGKYIEQFGTNLGEIEKLDVDFADNNYKWINLLETIKNKISNLSHIGDELDADKAKTRKKGLPILWLEVRKRLEGLAQDNNYIKLSEYEKICKDVGIFEKSNDEKDGQVTRQQVLLKFLHNLGVVINFDDAFLRNYLILNPNWLTKSLYMALEDKTIKDKQSGKFTSQQIQTLWSKNKYSDEDYNILLNLMLKDNFEIAYKVEGKRDDYVIPMLLPDTPLKYKFETENVITLIIRFIFMPYGVFSRLVVQLNNYIDTQEINGIEKQIVWKKGMLLKSEKGSFAEIIESDDREQTPKEIKIRVSGKNVLENKRFLDQIVNHIYQINRNWFNDNLKFDELIPCTCEVCYKAKKDEDKQLFKRKTLESYLRANRYEIPCDRSVEKDNLQDVGIVELLGGVYLMKPQDIKLSELFGDTYNFNDEALFVKKAMDNVSIRQRGGAIPKKRR